ncbi:hypothetical protein CI610_03378 [invertebrate metagenome]|uniref:Uncharacterized protein n=1 Tax=invertebrate metagenome TaxID=1711999 RepID=A0A2H9T385_9ZZZZ
MERVKWINNIKHLLCVYCLFFVTVLLQANTQAASPTNHQKKTSVKDNAACEVLGEVRIKTASARAAIVVNRQDMVDRQLQLKVYDTKIKLDKIWVYSAQNKYHSIPFQQKLNTGGVTRSFRSEKDSIEKIIVFYKNIGKKTGKIILYACQ